MWDKSAASRAPALFTQEKLIIVGKVEFTGESFHAWQLGYGIAVQNDIVIVYIGDSEQLFAFRFTPEGEIVP